MFTRTITGLAIAAALLGAGAARAADLSAAPVYKAPPPVAMFDWTGFYIGANVGFGSAHTTLTVPGASATEDLNGVLGGGQIGYNWQFTNWIFGLELDGQGTDQHNSTSVPGITLQDSLPWFVTARARLGYAIAPMWMIYATGGAAITDYSSTFTVAGLGSVTSDTTHAGWTAGAGIEAAINRNWSWKLEYLHLDTGNFNTALFNVKLTDDIGRFGVNYRF
jgi:outer membrane immunogenic protein